mmetsp:Transcript_12085/g.17611  ORF Transcript_12085/g.17611 Transcript_12085/m.17611 type:complete len:369 (-) Transcript_12085:54-1160(-)
MKNRQITMKKCNHANDTKKRSYDASSIDRDHDNCKKLKARWAVPMAKSLPSYPLERSVLIDGNAQIVASRIDECLRTRSVQAIFNDDKVRAECTTDSFLKYYVTLYDSSRDRVDGKAGTIVEVQRRKGCPMEFVRERCAIINAARGYKDIVSNQKQIHLSIPASINELSSYRPSKEDLRDMLKGVVGQFHTGYEDGRILCLDHLACMTNSDNANSQTSFQVVKMILECDIGISEIIGTILASPYGDELNVKMRHSCLVLLSNILDLLSADQTKTIPDNLIAEQGQEDWLVQSVLPCLIVEIKSCRCLHNACLSSKCLRLLVTSCPAVRTKATNCELMNVLENTVSLAEKNHAKLEKETKFAINALVCH